MPEDKYSSGLLLKSENYANRIDTPPDQRETESAQELRNALHKVCSYYNSDKMIATAGFYMLLSTCLTTPVLLCFHDTNPLLALTIISRQVKNHFQVALVYLCTKQHSAEMTFAEKNGGLNIF